MHIHTKVAPRMYAGCDKDHLETFLMQCWCYTCDPVWLLYVDYHYYYNYKYYCYYCYFNFFGV